MGAMGPRALVAWIESECDIAWLCVAGQGRLVLERSLARSDTLDFGYEGCHVQYLTWHGDRVVVVTRESSRSYLRSLDPDGLGEVGASFAWDWCIDRDLVIWVGDDPGLLSVAALPSLDARPPLPFRGSLGRGSIRLKLSEDGRLDVQSVGPGGSKTVVDTVALPSERQRIEYAGAEGLLDWVERHLFPSGGASKAGRLVIEALAYPYVRGAIWRRKWEPAPVWMPAYWHRYLNSTGRQAEACELVELLDRMAAPLADEEPERGWDREWNSPRGQVELAVHYVRRMARILAAVCRSGMLPEGWWCLLFDPAPRSEAAGSRVDPSGYPPLLRQVFVELAGTSPERLAERH